jgi:BolA protein
MTGTRAERIQAMLEQAFACARVTVRDDSARHVGHAGARDGAGHFFVRIESQQFAGRSRLERHRLVYKALAEMLAREIHALNIVAVSPDEDSLTRTQ